VLEFESIVLDVRVNEAIKKVDTFGVSLKLLVSCDGDGGFIIAVQVGRFTGSSAGRTRIIIYLLNRLHLLRIANPTRTSDALFVRVRVNNI
jgi:hypothetical protein